MFASTGTKDDRTGTKDSVSVIRETGVFCVNIVSEDLRDAMNTTSATFPAGTDEFAKAGLDKAPCESINAARVAAAPAALECKLTQIITLEGAANYLVLGEVTGVHMRDDCIRDGRFDVATFKPLSRLGYRDYAVVGDTFELARPDD